MCIHGADYLELALQGPDPASSLAQVSQYSYLVKIVNPEYKSRFVTKIWHNVSERFDSPDSLKQKLVENFEDKLAPVSSLDIGYFKNVLMERGG